MTDEKEESIDPLKRCVWKKYAKEHHPELRISRIDFGMLSSSEIIKLAHMEVTNPELYMAGTPTPAKDGPLDPRLGISNKSGRCDTCKQDLTDCVGHFGYVDLALPVYHIGFFKTILRVYQSVCKTCARLLVTPQQHKFYVAEMKRVSLFGKLKRAKLSKRMTEDLCRKVRHCYYCTSINGKVVKATKYFGILHKKYEHKDSKPTKEKLMDEFKTATVNNAEMGNFVKNISDDPNPMDVLHLFQRVSQEDCYLLDLPISRPEDMILTHILVPPVCVRPSVPMGFSGTQEDDLTVKVRDIVVISNNIRSSIASGARNDVFMDLWHFLQHQVAMYINSDTPGFPNQGQQVKQIRALVQRLKGKHGRFRWNLSGKRVDFSARTVISPDPNLQVDQVAVPLRVAMTMTFPEVVNDHNIQSLRNCILNGPDNYPGANFVQSRTDGQKQFLKYGNRSDRAMRLRVGDTVERHMKDDDVVLFNRQPSLHRVSIMAHRAKVMPWRTFRFNLCACNPYNADFDGDEMNMHLPQTHEARAEAAHLMIVHNNFVTPKHGEPLVVPLQDFLTAMYLITNKDVFVDRSRFAQLCCMVNDANERVEMPPPAILKPVRLWTGKQVVSILLRPNRAAHWPRLNLECASRQYPKRGAQGRVPCMDALDRFVVFRHGVHICGNLDKKILGSSKTGMFLRLIRDHSAMHAARVMNRLSKLCARWLGERGFSIGISDVTPSEELTVLKEEMLRDGYDKCDEFVGEFELGKMIPQPGCTKL
eukprot:709806_1